MANVNRALSGPINIHCDHSDSMGARDTGWIQLYGEAHQEAYDNHVMAMRIAEHPEIRTPVMTMMDGFVVSGAIGPLQQLTDEQVQEFIGPFKAVNPLLDSANPVTVGPFDGLHGWFFEHKASQQRAMERALRVIDEVAKEYAKLSGRRYGLIDPYMHGRRRRRHRRHRLDRRRHAHDRRQAARPGRQGRHDPRARLPALPRRRVRQGARRLQGRRRARPRRVVRRRRAARCSSRSARRSTTASRVPGCCRSSTGSAAATSSPTTSKRRSPP